MPERGDAQAAVAAVWGRVLGVEHVDPHTGFFDLGADSLMVLEAVGALRPRWPGIRVVDVFANPTVASLAAHLGPGRPGQTSAPRTAPASASQAAPVNR